MNCKQCGKVSRREYCPSCNRVGTKRVNCRKCGTEFVLQAPHQKYCEEHLSLKSRAIERPKRDVITRAERLAKIRALLNGFGRKSADIAICQKCGDEFEPRRIGQQYCSVCRPAKRLTGGRCRMCMLELRDVRQKYCFEHRPDKKTQQISPKFPYVIHRMIRDLELELANTNDDEEREDLRADIAYWKSLNKSTVFRVPVLGIVK